ncbi:MAG: PHP-associated domain-containing protein, partial [Sulfolobales archaeon]
MDGYDIVRVALIRGLRAIAVTDHNTFSGYKLALEAVERIGASLVVIPGIEVRTSRGDLIALCENPEPEIERAVGKAPEEIIDLSRERGCVTYAPHPFDIRRLGLGRAIYGLKLDAIEVFNALSDPLSNRKAEKARRELGISGLSNSDAHVKGFVGVSHNIFEVGDLRAEDILEGVRRGPQMLVKARPGITSYLSHILRVRRDGARCNI